MNGFRCPREGCDSSGWGTITDPDGHQEHVCNGTIRDEHGRAIKSCDFSYPCTGNEPARTRSDRAAVITQLGNAALELAKAFTTLDPDDELALEVCEASVGQMLATVTLLKDDCVSARLGREAGPS